VFLAALAGGWTGHHFFPQLLKFVCLGAFPWFVGHSGDAARLAQWSFAVALGLACAAVPAVALLALRFVRRAPYFSVMVRALWLGALMFFLAAFYYRQQMARSGATRSEFFEIFWDSKTALVLNPLTRTALISAGSILIYGLVKATISHSRSGKCPA
jgi:hypothetical protein